jgi:hypothetical protein
MYTFYVSQIIVVCCCHGDHDMRWEVIIFNSSCSERFQSLPNGFIWQLCASALVVLIYDSSSGVNDQYASLDKSFSYQVALNAL